MNTICPFCDEKNFFDRLIKENQLAMAFPTNIPIVPGHTLIVPKRHVASFADLSQEEMLSILELAHQVKQAMHIAFQASGANFAWNEGVVAGQTVPHFHLHIVPRKKGDDGIYEYEPRKFLYRPGSRAKSENEELVAVANLIKNYL